MLEEGRPGAGRKSCKQPTANQVDEPAAADDVDSDLAGRPAPDPDDLLRDDITTTTNEARTTKPRR